MSLPKYVGIFLTPASKRALLKEFPAIHPNVSADHVTLAYNPGRKLLARLVPGTLVKFRVRGYVEDDKGQAITVELPAPYDDLAERDPHVTISTADGVKGVYSNSILGRAQPTTAHTYTGIVDWDKRRAPVRTRRFPMGALKTAAQWDKLRPNDRVKVYHGTRFSEIHDLINGFDATKVQPRHYGGPRHRGVFVSPEFKLAKRFGNEIVLELEVRAKFLHGTDYSGNIGRGTGPHGPVSVHALERAEEKYPDSFRPYLSETLLQNVEPQALLIGLVAPRQIKRVYYTPYGKTTGKWYTRKQFLDLGLEVSPGGYRRKEKVRDLGVDLSYPGLSYDRFLDAIVKVLDIRRSEVEKTLKWRAEVSVKPGRSDVLEEMIEQIGFEPVAARVYADLVRERLSVKQVAARYIEASDSRSADLSPPLGYPGGTCHVVDRIDDADPPGEDNLIDMVEDGHDLTNPEAARVYDRHVERGAWKYNMLLGPHAQYRMDLRGITVPEVRLALKRFFRAWNDARSEGDTYWDEEMARQRPIDWIDKRQHLHVSFKMFGRDAIKVITVFRPGDQDPPATDC